MRNVGSGQRDAKVEREQRGEKRIRKKKTSLQRSVAVTAAASERASVKRRLGRGGGIVA